MARYQPGDVIACYVVVKLLEDAPAREHRRYLVQATCCGRELERAEETLAEYGRRPRERCLHCAQALGNVKKRKSCGFHERFGPVKVIGRGEKVGHWRVVWDCCGGEVELSRRYLLQLRRDHRAGKPTPVCRACNNVVALARLHEHNRASHAWELAAWRATRAAQQVKAPVAAQPAAPVGVLRKTASELEEGPIKVRSSAQLAPGVISAAVAWPRPGAGI